MPHDGEPPVASRSDWAQAYAKQSGSDFAIYQLLAPQSIALCHPLHYLQMACEKIAKAYRFRDTATSEERLTSEHVAFSQFIESYLGSPGYQAEVQWQTRATPRDHEVSQEACRRNREAGSRGRPGGVARKCRVPLAGQRARNDTL